MFLPPQRSGSKRWSLAQAASFITHIAALWVICLGPAAIVVKRASVAQGDHGATTILYFSPPGPQQTLVAERSKPVPARLYLPVKEKPKFNARVTERKDKDKDAEPQNSDPISTSTPGLPSGSDTYGSSAGVDVRPAIETTLLEPPVSKAEIPPGIEGDVIIEIAIDEHGNVTGTRLLKGFGYGIDEKILATVRNWHYRPATRDGIPIPSKNDHYWHFRG